MKSGLGGWKTAMGTKTGLIEMPVVNSILRRRELKWRENGADLTFTDGHDALLPHC